MEAFYFDNESHAFECGIELRASPVFLLTDLISPHGDASTPHRRVLYLGKGSGIFVSIVRVSLGTRRAEVHNDSRMRIEHIIL